MHHHLSRAAGEVGGASRRERVCQSMPRVFIPAAMRELAGGRTFVEAMGANVQEVISDVDRQLPGFRDRVCQANALRPGLSVVVNCSASALGTLQKVAPADEIHFLPAIGGG